MTNEFALFIHWLYDLAHKREPVNVADLPELAESEMDRLWDEIEAFDPKATGVDDFAFWRHKHNEKMLDVLESFTDEWSKRDNPPGT